MAEKNAEYDLDPHLRALIETDAIADTGALLPFNGQTSRAEVVREILQQGRIDRIVETGTFLGSTTLWLAGFGKPVITAEIDKRHYDLAQKRLKDFANVQIKLGNSVDVLRELANDASTRDKPTFFYLDAHWESYLPLRDELNIIFDNFSRSAIVVDDFKVPGDTGYDYDSYSSENELTLEYIGAFAAEPHAVYFPAAPSVWETGQKRGWVTLTKHPGLARVLDHFPLLRRWRKGD